MDGRDDQGPFAAFGSEWEPSQYRKGGWLHLIRQLEVFLFFLLNSKGTKAKKRYFSGKKKETC